MNLENIKELQDADEGLQKLKDKHPNLYFLKDINQTQNVLCYVRAGKDKDKSWKIVLPEKLLKSTIKWFHIVTGHSGWNRLYMTIGARYYHPALKAKIRSFKCNACQKHKLPGKGYGLLSERELKEQPFDKVAVDLIGPWEVKIGNNEYTFKIAQDTIDDFILIDEDKIAEGIKFNFEKHKLVTEGAAATSIMAVKDQLSSHFGKNTICLLCGGNIDSELFGKIIS